MTERGAALSDRDLAQLLSTMRGLGSSPPRADSAPQRDVSFATHPLARQMKLQREFAAATGLRSPYYRQHDVRAGATSVIEGQPVLNFASYDYLGLNGHPEITAAVERAVRTFGTSVSASRLSAGERSVHRELEAALARLYAAEDCIAFVSGHAGAVSTVATLMGPKDLIVHDALIHNCIIVGAQLAGSARRSFPHNDLEALDHLLTTERDRFDRVLIVSEGLFSMDGDGPDLGRLVALKRAHDAVLMIDDAHGLGVLGAAGRGIFEHQDVAPSGVDIWLGTLSKSLVSCGGYVAACGAIVDLLRHQAPGFVYSVGMPAGAAVAATVALEIMGREPERVRRLQERSQEFWRVAKAAGLDVSTSWGYGVIPIIVGDTARTLALSQRLLARGINAFPILPPGVPERTARLRFFLNQTHEPEQIRLAVQTAAEELAELKDYTLDRILMSVTKL
jgi:8-amino-7-oxononanoate synthase